MNSENLEFENEFKKLNEFYELKKPENIHQYMKNNKKLIELLNVTKNYLKEAFPKGTFELEMYYDLNGDCADHLLLNIFVDRETYNNGFIDKIFDIDMKILPLQKEMDLLMALNLIPRIKSN